LKKYAYLIAFIFVVQTTKAQFIKEKSINAQFGFAFSYPDQSVTDAFASGFISQADLILETSSWVELRPYAGFMFTSAQDEDLNGNPTDEQVHTRAFFFGGKVRLKAPIPFVAPYIELGLGASIGSFRTLTAFDNIDNSGLTYHFPIAFGLELGRHHNIDLGIMYMGHPDQSQYSGAFAVGVTIPLNSKSTSD
jgi:hypothetical protein